MHKAHEGGPHINAVGLGFHTSAETATTTTVDVGEMRRPAAQFMAKLHDVVHRFCDPGDGRKASSRRGLGQS